MPSAITAATVIKCKLIILFILQPSLMFTAQSHLFPFPLYLPPICIWRLKSQQKLFSMWVFFSCHCPSSALLSVCDAYTHTDTHAQILSRDLSLLISSIYINLSWNHCTRRDHEPLHVCLWRGMLARFLLNQPLPNQWNSAGKPWLPSDA